jgi:hypothetical protein
LPSGLARRRSVTGSPRDRVGEREDIAVRAEVDPEHKRGDETVVGCGVRSGPPARAPHPASGHRSRDPHRGRAIRRTTCGAEDRARRRGAGAGGDRREVKRSPRGMLGASSWSPRVASPCVARASHERRNPPAPAPSPAHALRQRARGPPRRVSESTTEQSSANVAPFHVERLKRAPAL